MYKVIWKEEAEKGLREIRRFDPSAAREIKTRVEGHLATNPTQNGKPLEYQWQGFYSYRIDKYRVIYEIEERELVILVVEVGKRQARKPSSIYGRKPPSTTQRPKARELGRKVVGNRGKRKLGRK